MKTRLFLLSAIIIVCTTSMFGQTDSKPIEEFNTASPGFLPTGHPKNYLKVNLTAIALKSYSLQYERSLTRKISVAISFRTMPETSIPFKNKILDIAGNDPDTKNAIESLRLSNTAITPELRLYLSKRGFGRGFYLAPFYRHASFSAGNIIFNYQDINSVQSSIALSGKLTSNTAGLLLGAQWSFGRYICLDWWILGPHYGKGNGVFSAIPSQALSTEEQDDLRQQLNNIDIPLTNKTVSVTANQASMTLDGPWGGIRAGISLGIRF